MHLKTSLILICVLTHLAIGATDMAPLVSGGKTNCAIVCDQTDPLCARTAMKIADYLSEHTGVRPPVLAQADAAAIAASRTLILIDGSEKQNLLSKFVSPVEIPGDRADAYALKVVRKDSRYVVAVTGRSAAGAKYAAYRLMEEMRIDGRNAEVGLLDVNASPFFATRSVSLFNIWRVPVETIRQCNLESWPAEKIQQSIDTYDAFGFNAVETHDRFHEDFLKAVYGITREQWRQKVYALCDRAHADGMTVFLRLWGNSVALPVKELMGGYTPFGFDNLAPDIPEERKRWEVEIRDYASKNYASHIDHLIGHWADAGGVHPGSHATVKDSMLLHNELVSAFRAINRKIESTFNLWGMANPRGKRGWPGYEDHRSICDAGILPKDVGIAQTTRSRSHAYKEEVSQDIIASGHPAAVWTWRRADTEVRFGDAGLRIRIHGVMGDYFHNLPDSARRLAWHNIERNHHGIATDVNYYIAGKLMWDSRTDVDAALMRYCTLVFGEANAAPAAQAFNAIEASRDVENTISRDMIENPAAGAKRVQAALDALARVELKADHHSRLPSVTSPGEMLDELRGTLTIIAENARISAEELPALDALTKDGKTAEATAKADALRAKADTWFGTVNGGVEGAWLRNALDAKAGNPPRPRRARIPASTSSSAAKAD